MNAGEVIQAARDVHPGFFPEWQPQGVLLRQLALYQRRLLSKIAPLRPDAIVAVHEIAIADYSFVTGEELPPHLLVHGADVFYTNDPDHPVDLKRVPFADRNIPFWPPSGYFSRTHLFLLGTADEWTAVETVKVRYFPRGEDVLGPTGVLALPDDAKDACVQALALFMARRTPAAQADPPIRISDFVEQAAESESVYLDDVTGRRQVIVHNPVEQW